MKTLILILACAGVALAQTTVAQTVIGPDNLPATGV